MEIEVLTKYGSNAVDEGAHVCWCPFLIKFVKCKFVRHDGSCRGCSVAYLRSRRSVVGGC